MRSIRRGTATLLIWGILVALGAAGCGSITPVAPADRPVTDPERLFVRLAFDHPAVTMSTADDYRMLRLTATPRNPLGEAIADLPLPAYRSTDETKVTVTPEGLVTALSATNGVYVIADLTVGPIRHVDSSLVVVKATSTPPKLASISVQPVLPDTAIRPWQPNMVSLVPYLGSVASTNLNLIARAVDVTGTAIPGLPYIYTSLDPKIATVGRRSGSVLPQRPGSVRLVAQTMAYGTIKSDTVVYTITVPAVHFVTVQPNYLGEPVFVENAGGSLEPSRDIYVAPHGLVFWSDWTGVDDGVDVIFDDPTKVVAPSADFCNTMPILAFLFPSNCGPSGNVFIPPLDQDWEAADPGLGSFATLQVRQFPVPGVYPYHSARLGIGGRVIVTTEF